MGGGSPPMRELSPPGRYRLVSCAPDKMAAFAIGRAAYKAASASLKVFEGRITAAAFSSSGR